jgi:glycosyltransferase involved in cell wall biosynthesis
VIVEAMLSGVVVVATPAGGAAQQITPGVTGLAFEHGNHRDLAARIQELMSQPELRETLANRALHEARRRYSAAFMARQVAATYADALGDLGGPTDAASASASGG